MEQINYEVTIVPEDSVYSSIVRLTTNLGITKEQVFSAIVETYEEHKDEVLEDYFDDDKKPEYLFINTRKLTPLIRKKYPELFVDRTPDSLHKLTLSQ